MDEKFSTDFYNDSIENYKKYYCGGRVMINYTFWDTDYNEILLHNYCIYYISSFFLEKVEVRGSVQVVNLTFNKHNI